MVSIVLASHGDLAAGIKQTGSMVFGDQPSVAVVLFRLVRMPMQCFSRL